MSFINTFACLFAVLSRGSIPAGIGGMSISYAMNVTQILNWMVRMSSQREQNIVSVERVVEYANVDQEAPFGPEKALAKNWPQKGALEAPGIASVLPMIT